MTRRRRSWQEVTGLVVSAEAPSTRRMGPAGHVRSLAAARDPERRMTRT
jgi:hypothetical protein